MNASSVLRISLGANAALVAIVLGLLARSTPVAPVPVASMEKPASVSTRMSQSADVEGGFDTPRSWDDSMAELRRVGVSSALIARLVVEKVAQKWTPIETELQQKYLHGEIDAAELARRHDQRAAEEEAELRAALGAGYLAWDVEHTVDNMYLGGLVPSEAQKRPLYDLQMAHLARLHQLEVAQREGRLDQQAFDTAHASEILNFKTGLAAIIGADRVDGLPTANATPQVCADFARLGLNDQQMTALSGIYEKWSAARADLDHSLAKSGEVDSAYEGDLLALDRGRDEDYRRVLGDGLFDAWQRAGDDRYRVMLEHADDWGLDASMIASVYTAIRAYDLAVVSREYEAQLREQAGGSGDWATVQTDVAAYTHDIEGTLRARLGDERFQRLCQASVISLREPDLAKSQLGERPRL